MIPPSPSDFCWVIRDSPQERSIAPVVRAAVTIEWLEAQKIAAAHLGDQSPAQELMELAIQQTAECLADLPQVGVDEARTILMRFFANAVRRRRRADRKLCFPGIGAKAEVRSPSANAAFLAVEAELDLEEILRETSPELRHVLLMRYGARSQWDEIAQETSKSKDAIRKSCERELKRIRKKLKIRERAE
jgi:hypothetical protein